MADSVLKKTKNKKKKTLKVKNKTNKKRLFIMTQLPLSAMMSFENDH